MLVRAVFKHREGLRAPEGYWPPARDYKRACEQSQVESCEYRDEQCDVKKLESSAYLIPLEMNDEQTLGRPDRWLVSEGAVDGPLMNQEGDGRSPHLVDGVGDQGILASEEGTCVHTYNLKQRTTKTLVSGGLTSGSRVVLT